MKKLLIVLLVSIPFNCAISLIPADADGLDDCEVIVSRIRESLPRGGLISIEQHTGRLLYNPVVDKLHSMVAKQKFMLPAMVVNQVKGLTLVKEMPFSCFLMTGGELASDEYEGYRQHDTVRYIREVKDFQVSRVLICETIGKTAKTWSTTISLDEEADPFVFDEHVSIKGEHFYYYVGSDGSFEMYM